MDVRLTDRSLGELFSALSHQTSDLIRQEMRLAKTELSEKAAGVARHAMLIGAGAAFMACACMALIARSIGAAR